MDGIIYDHADARLCEAPVDFEADFCIAISSAGATICTFQMREDLYTMWPGVEKDRGSPPPATSDWNADFLQQEGSAPLLRGVLEASAMCELISRHSSM